MNRSLRKHLSIVLGGTILLAGLLVAFASFRLAYSEAKELQDDMLKQIAALPLANTDNPVSAPLQIDGLPDTAISDPESRVTIIHLPHDGRPAWLAVNMPPGLHTIVTENRRMRVLVHDDNNGQRIVVYQPTDAGDEIALNSALRTLIPLLLLLPVLFGLIAWIVRRELAPVTLLAGNLDERRADDLRPLVDRDIPGEITPFVHAINRLLERVYHLITQQRRFIADAAHELRSPLTALSLQAQNVRLAGSLEVAQQRVVPLQAGIERSRQLTEQLLTLARTQIATNELTRVNVSLLARALIAEYLPMAESKHIDLGLEERVALTLSASPDTLYLIVKNALENALKYAPPNGEVTIRLLSNGDTGVIEVEDNGPGIPASERERVFDAFYRMQDTLGQGSGLGLTIAREAASRLGGTVSLHDHPDGPGLVFRYQQTTVIRWPEIPPVKITV